MGLVYPTPQDPSAEPAQEAVVNDNQPPCPPEEPLAASHLDREPPSGPGVREPEETHTEHQDPETDATGTAGRGEDSEGEEGKGVKRKGEDLQQDEEVEQSTKQQKVRESLVVFTGVVAVTLMLRIGTMSDRFRGSNQTFRFS